MPKIKEQDLKKHILSKDFKNLYVLYGEEKLLVKHYTDLLIEKIAGKTPSDFCYHIFDNDSDLNQISVAIQVIPFMCEYNCVKITDLNCEDLTADDLKEYINILSKIPKTTIVIITMPTLIQDEKKLGKFKKIIDLADKNGIVVQYSTKSNLELERQISSWVNKRGSSITPACCTKIIEYCGTDLLTLKNEVEKLCAYADGLEITPEMIDLLTVKKLEAKIYALSDSVISCKSDLAFKQLDALFYQREEPVVIISVLASAYVDIYRARVAAESGEPMKTVADAFNYRNRAFVLDKAQRNARNLTTVAIRKSLDTIINTDLQLKSVAVNPRILVEKCIAQLIMIAHEGKPYA